MLNYLSSIRLRVFLGISLISVVVLGIVGYRAYLEWNLRLEYAGARVQNTAQALAATHNDLVQYTAGLIDSLAHVAAVSQFASSDDCSRDLAQERQNVTTFISISVLAVNGIVLCTTGAASATFNVVESPYFRKALSSPRLIIGEALHDDAPGKFVLPFYKGIFADGGKVNGVVIVLVDLSWAGQELAKGDNPEGTRVGLVDAKGSLLALHPVPKDWVTRDISKTPLFKAIVAGRNERSFVETGLDGARRVYGTARFADTDAGPLTLFVSVPSYVALAEVRRDSIVPLAATLALIVLTFVVGAMGVDRLFLTPARALASAARRFTAGDLSARSGVAHGANELGQLAESIDTMADSLEAEKRHALLANRALHQLSDALRRIPAAIAYIDTAERCLYANRAYESWFAITPERIKGMTIREMLGNDAYAAVQGHVRGALRGEPQRFDMPFPDAEGGVRQAAVSYIPDLGPAGIAGFFIFANDVTDHKRQTEVFARLAHVDSLTGLPNRLTFMELLDQAHKRAQRDGTSLAVLFLDLDDLKQINDTFGHGMGDAVLKRFAQNVKASVRAVDVVARLGGDEFTVLIDDLRTPDAVQAVVDKLQAALALPTVIAGHPMVINASIGVAQRRAQDTTPEQLLEDADAAMYRVKNQRKGSA